MEKFIWIVSVVLVALGGPFLVGYIFFNEGTLVILLLTLIFMTALIVYEVLFGQLSCPVDTDVIKAIGK